MQSWLSSRNFQPFGYFDLVKPGIATPAELTLIVSSILHFFNQPLRTAISSQSRLPAANCAAQHCRIKLLGWLAICASGQHGIEKVLGPKEANDSEAVHLNIGI